MYTYLEIVRFNGQEVVKRLDVTGESKKMIDLIEGGMNRNLNHSEYYTRETKSETELPKI